MKKGKLFYLFSIICICISCILISAQAQNAKTKILKCVTLQTEEKVFYNLVNAFVSDVKEASNGQLVIEIIGDESSIPSDQQIFMVKDRVADIAFDIEHLSSISLAYTSLIFSRMMPWEEREIGLHDLWRETFIKEAGVYWLGRSTGTQFFVIGTNKEIHNLKDLAGLKIRSNAPNAPAIEALGAVPIVIPVMDIIPAMQRNLVDGFLMTTEDWVERGFADVTKYLINIRLLEGAQSGILVNIDTWNSLSEQEKDWLQGTYLKNEKLYYSLMYWSYVSGMDKIPKAGVRLLEWTPEEQERAKELAFKGVWSSLKTRMKPEYIDEFVEYVPYLK